MAHAVLLFCCSLLNDSHCSNVLATAQMNKANFSKETIAKCKPH